MIEEKSLCYWQRADLTQPIAFLGVPYRLADAIARRAGHAGQRTEMTSGGGLWQVAINIEADLRAKVKAETLRVQSSLDRKGYKYTLRTSVLTPVDVIALFSEYGFELRFVEGIEGDSVAETTFATLASVAKEAAGIEASYFDKAGNPAGELVAARRRDLERKYLTRLRAEVREGSLSTADAPIGSEEAAPDALLTPSGRESALELLGLLVRHTEAGETAWSLSSSEERSVEAKNEEVRHAKGLFFMSEAVQILAISLELNALNARKLLDAFEEAANAGKLTYRDTQTERPISFAERPVMPRADLVHVEDVDQLLAQWRVSYRFPERSSKPEALVRPMQAQTQQEAAVLERIAALGFSPLALPKARNGKAGMKAQVRDAIGLNVLFQSHAVFNKAWQRLRDAGRIRDA